MTAAVRTYEAHPAADIFPRMDETRLAEKVKADAAGVTHEAKAAVWAALAQPRSGYAEIARVTGLDWLLVAEIVAQGRAHITIDDADRQAIRISRKGAMA